MELTSASALTALIALGRFDQVTIWGEAIHEITGWYRNELGGLSVEYVDRAGREQLSHAANVTIRNTGGGLDLIRALVRFLIDHVDQMEAIDAAA